MKGLDSYSERRSDEKTCLKWKDVKGQDWIGLRIRHKGKITDFIYQIQLAARLMHSNSWIMSDGWMTDAVYKLCAVSTQKVLKQRTLRTFLLLMEVH